MKRMTDERLAEIDRNLPRNKRGINGLLYELLQALKAECEHTTKLEAQIEAVKGLSVYSDADNNDWLSYSAVCITLKDSGVSNANNS